MGGQEGSMNNNIKTELFERLETLSYDEQRRVLNFVRSLTEQEPIGLSGEEFVQFAGLIPQEDLKVMAEAIEEACEVVEPDEW